MDPHAHAEVRDERASSQNEGIDLSSPEELRAQLLPRLAHELRVQLQAIAASSAVLRRMEIDESLLRDASSILDRSARELNRLLDDLVDLVSVEQGTLVLDRSPTPLHDLIEHAIACAGDAISRRRLRIASCRPSSVVMASCDADRAQRLLIHVLRHAVESTSTGGSLSVRCSGCARHVEVEVTSAVVALTDVTQQTVLEPALRHRPSASSLLGLHLAHLLTAALGGALFVEQIGELRTRITLTLPKT